jgi:hypothetical protein
MAGVGNMLVTDHFRPAAIAAGILRPDDVGEFLVIGQGSAKLLILLVKLVAGGRIELPTYGL